LIAGINAEGGTGLVKLRKLVRAYGEVMATDFGASLVRFDVRDLSDKNAEVVRAAKRSIDHTFRGYITEGISDGSIKPCDAKLAAFAIAGSLNWIGHWYRSDGHCRRKQFGRVHRSSHRGTGAPAGCAKPRRPAITITAERSLRERMSNIPNSTLADKPEPGGLADRLQRMMESERAGTV